jgi:rubrerythrin
MSDTASVIAEGSYEWWAAEVARLREVLAERTAELVAAEARAEHAEKAAVLNRERENEARRELAEAQHEVRQENYQKSELKAAIERVRVQHRQDDPYDPMCRHCGMTWPCPTIRVLAATEPHAPATP